ncbi:MAG: peptide chain release factor 2 [bacterium]
MELKEIKELLFEIKGRISKLEVYLDIENKRLGKEQLVAKTLDSKFWNNAVEAKKTQGELKLIETDINKIKAINDTFYEVTVLLELLETENDAALVKELNDKINVLKGLVEREEFNLLFTGKYVRNNAIVTVHSGAGGTEACDWAEMLLRMYLMWAGKKGFKATVTEISPGDGAGIKSATIEVLGDYAYGWFHPEKGVHRLVRISPFDANKRRHTSFASVEIIPEIEEEDTEIEIKDDDLKIDTYRASGAGGQHVNKTESAIRITHIPTNTIVACQVDRSQGKNRAMAMRILKSKLQVLYEEQKREEMVVIAGEKKAVSFGSQIRSYVFAPYKMIKDTRTGYEVGDVDKVMDGGLDQFVIEYLKTQAEKKAGNNDAKI